MIVNLRPHRHQSAMYKPGKVLLLVMMVMISLSVMHLTATAQSDLTAQLAQPVLPQPAISKSTTPVDAATVKQAYTQVQRVTQKLKRLQLAATQLGATQTNQGAKTEATPFAGLELTLAEVQKNGVTYGHNYWSGHQWVPLDQALDPDFWHDLGMEDLTDIDEELLATFSKSLQDKAFVKTTYGNQTYGDVVYQQYLAEAAQPDQLTPALAADGVPAMPAFQAWMVGRFFMLDMGLTTVPEVQADYKEHFRDYLVKLSAFMDVISDEDSLLKPMDLMVDILDSEMAEQYFIRPTVDGVRAAFGDLYTDQDFASLDPDVTFAANTQAHVAPALDRMITTHQGQDWLTMAAFSFVPIYAMTNPAAIAAPVTVTYTTQAGDSLAAEQMITGNIGDHYDTTTPTYQLTIDGYTLDDTQLPSNAQGQLTSDAQTVKYIYTKDVVAGAPVTVKHQDTNGKALVADQVFHGNIGDPYQTKAAEITGYTFDQVIGAISGTFSATAQTVIYTYTKDAVAGAPVTVHHQNEAGDALADSETLTGNIGAVVQTKAKQIDGYVFKSVTGSPLVTISDQPQTVTYVYTPTAIIGGVVTIDYLDETGQKIAPTTKLAGTVGAAFEAAPLTLTGYTLVEDTTTISGHFTTDPQAFAYHYRKDPEPVTTGEVLVRYVDQHDQQLAAPTLLTGELGTAYTTHPKDIANYQLVDTEGDATGDFKAERQTVTYRYEPIKDPITTGTVVVTYVDEQGEALADQATLTGPLGTTYQTALKTIDGYTYQKVTGNPSGQFTATTQTVTYHYQKTPVAVAQGRVIVTYVDLAGKTLQAKTVLAGPVGETYQTMAAKIKGYTQHDVIGSPKGTFTKADQTVTYRYQSNKPVAPTEDEVTSETTTEAASDMLNPGKPSSTADTTSIGATTPLKPATASVLTAPASTGKLPQANERRSKWPIGLGAGLVAVLGVMVWCKRRHV